MNAKEENCLRFQFTVRILYLTVRPWDLSQKQNQGKTVRLGRSEFKMISKKS